MSSNDTTGKSLVAHWGWAASKGLMKANTASALRAACSQVMGVLDDWENIDVRTLDVEDTYQRFQNKRAKDFTPESLEAYKRRFAQSVKLFLEYADDPAGWKFVSREPSRKEKKVNGNGEADTEFEGAEPAPQARAPAPPASGLVDYPFPVRPGRLAVLRLPADLKASEVKRLSVVLESLAVDEASADDSA